MTRLRRLRAGTLLAAMALGIAGTAWAVVSAGWPFATLTIWAVPIGLLPMAYPRRVVIPAIALLALGAVAALHGLGTLGEDGWARIPIPVLAIVVMTELVGFLARQRDRRDAALKRSEEHYRRIAENPAVVPWEVDLSCWRFTYVGPQVVPQLGYAQEEWYADGFWPEHIHPDDRDSAVCFCQTATERREDHEFEYRFLAADGSYRWLRDIVCVVCDDQGEPIGLRGVFIDISEQREAEEALRESQERMRRAQQLESLGILAGGIAHDFNNLLVGILGNASLALEALPEDSPVRTQVRDVETSAQRAAELTHQLLAYAGKTPVRTARHDLSALAGESVRLLEAALSKKASLEVDLDASRVFVEGDAAQLRQVVMNLITNAVEALEGREGTVQLRTGVERRAPASSEGAGGVVHGTPPSGARAFLEVADTGVGMETATLERMFDPFFTTKDAGHGLGLAAVLGIIRSHGGALRVQSTLREGTRIRVLLPLLEPSLARAETRSAAVDPVAADFAGRTVLIADDEEMVRRVMRAGVERAGGRVLAARDGVEAIETFRRSAEEIDAVILDMSMPRADGEQVLAVIRDECAGLPVLLTSGYARCSVETRGEPTGFLQKPFRSEALLSALQRVMGSPAA